MVHRDCIYFEEHEEETGWNHCKNSRRLDNKDSLCDLCRLWDSYIPNNSTEEEIHIERRKMITPSNIYEITNPYASGCSVQQATIKPSTSADGWKYHKRKK